MLRIALAQINSTVGDFPGNTRKILQYTEMACAAGVDLVIFPEMALCGYPPEDLLFKESFVQDNQKALRVLSGQTRRITALVGFVHRDTERRIYNAAGVIAAGRVQGIYHKHLLPNYGVFDEKRYFSEGRDYLLLDAGNTSIGLSICEDIWQDAGVHRMLSRAGVKVLVNLSASPYDFGKVEQRKILLSRRAKEMRAFICYANLLGGQDELIFDGTSLILDPKGRILASGKPFGEDLIVADIPLVSGHKPRPKLAHVRHLKITLGQHARQPLSRAPLVPKLSQPEHILQALILGVRDYVVKNGFSKVVIGLSGGIDSSLVATIAVQALGKDNVIGVSMPSLFTSRATKADAARLARNLGIRFMVVPIDDIFKSYKRNLKPAFAGCPFDVTEENIQARIRGNILMAFSNKFGWLVLTTGNKSEVAVGYCTLYGDLSGGFAVIKDVPKTIVYDLARHLNKTRGGIIPKSILMRAPTAELKQNQKDQDTLPAYNTLDRIIKAYVEDHRSLKQIVREVRDPVLVRKIIRMVDNSEYKRRQSPPGIKITPRAFGKDWRLPITNRYEVI